MSKYYKVEDVIDTLAEQWHYEVTIDYPYAADDIEEWKQNARELFADLPTIEVSEDCISREWLISFIDAGHLRNPNEKCYSENDVVELIKNAPSVVPSRAEGEWIMHVDDLFPCESTQECSVCHSQHLICGNDDNYCPYCGAYMKGAKGWN